MLDDCISHEAIMKTFGYVILRVERNDIFNNFRNKFYVSTFCLDLVNVTSQQTNFCLSVCPFICSFVIPLR